MYVIWSQVQTLNSTNSNVRKTDIILWNNKHITIAGRSVYYHDWHQVGIKRIKDLLSENNEFLSYDLFCEKFNLNTPFTLYHGLVAAIPKQWKRDLKDVSPRISQNQTCTLLRARPNWNYSPDYPQLNCTGRSSIIQVQKVVIGSL